MKILIAPDKFKSSLTALEVCQSIGHGLQASDEDIDLTYHPLADGGDGSIDILATHLSLKRIELTVLDPLFRDINAYYFYDEKENSAYIELAIASGLALLDEGDRNPLHTTTFGTGELIRHAIQFGAKRIFLFIGGSATNDAGMGIATALGFHFYDIYGERLAPIGKNLFAIDRIDASNILPNIQNCPFHILTDVNNILFGPQGAAFVYAKQKGANSSDIRMLDNGLRHYANIIYDNYGRDISYLPGGGAAGGIGAGLAGLLDVSLDSGIDLIFELTQFHKKLRQADLVISGEGRLDDQTLDGKVIGRVADLAKKEQIPLVLFVGKDELSKKGKQQLAAKTIFSVSDNATNMDDAMKNAGTILSRIAQNENILTT